MKGTRNSKLKNLQGIIFPNIVDTAVDCGLFRTHADFYHKALKSYDPDLNNQHKLSRNLSDLFDHKEKDEGLEKRKIINTLRKMLSVIRQTIKKENEFKISLSDYRSMGNWFPFKVFFTNNTSSISHYVLSLCEKEKETLSIINNISDEKIRFQEIIKRIRKSFHIHDGFFDKLNQPITSVNQNEIDNFPVLFNITLKTHQFLHLAAIIEHDLYGEDKFKYNAIKRLLPKLGKKGETTGSVNNLIIILYKKFGYSTLSEFIKHLSIDDINQFDAIRKKLDNWKRVNPNKSGKIKTSSFTPKDFNTLINNPRNRLDNNDNLPEQIILTAIVFDNLYRDALTIGMTPEWIINEFNHYPLYQDFPVHLSVV